MLPENPTTTIVPAAAARWRCPQTTTTFPATRRLQAVSKLAKRSHPFRPVFRMKRSSLVALVLLPAALTAQAKQNPLKYVAKPTVAAITPADLMSRLYVFADDSMNGRSAGTLWHDKGTDYIARELGRMGVKPAGDNGTYFQRIPLNIHNVAADSKFTVDGKDYVA